MKAPKTLIGTVARVRVLNRPIYRRGIFAALIAIFLLLSFFPERHRAAVTLTPSDPTTLGLSGTLGQLGAINSVFGNQAAVEVALKVARSIYVRDTAAKQLRLMERMKFSSPIQMHRWLEDEVEVRTLRGGMIQFETFLRDGDLGRDIVGAYAAATQAQLARISRTQTEYKRDVLVKLVSDASNRLARARGEYDSFRLRNQSPILQTSVEETAGRIPSLRAAIKAKEIELATTRQVATDENLNVRQLLTQLSALRAQLAQVESTTLESGAVGRAVLTSAQGERLYRELTVAQTLYDSYRRYLEGTFVEDLTSTANVRILEPPFIDTERQVNYSFLAVAMALLLLLLAIEFYRLRPPVGERLTVRETYA